MPLNIIFWFIKTRIVNLPGVDFPTLSRKKTVKRAFCLQCLKSPRSGYSMLSQPSVKQPNFQYSYWLTCRVTCRCNGDSDLIDCYWARCNRTLATYKYKQRRRPYVLFWVRTHPLFEMNVYYCVCIQHDIDKSQISLIELCKTLRTNSGLRAINSCLHLLWPQMSQLCNRNICAVSYVYACVWLAL